MRLPPPKATSGKPKQAPLPFPDDIVLRSITQAANVQSGPTDLIPRGPNFSQLRSDLPSADATQAAASIQAIVERKTQASSQQVSTVLANAQSKNQESKFIKINSEVNSFTGQATQERVVRLVEKPVDPLEPAKFRFRAVPRGPGSPPVPLLHSPTKKATAEERANWDIPTAISNWNNTRGFVVSLDKRLAQTQSLDAGTAVVNDRFAKLADSLFTAEDLARNMVEQRFSQRQQNEQRQAQEENEALRIAALEARAMRNKPQGNAASTAEEERVDRADRDLVRAERKRELDREMKLAAAGKRTKQMREEDRDISEQIALGMPLGKNAAVAEFDQRLFNRGEDNAAGGLASELSRADDADNVYTTSLFKPSASAYKPSQAVLDSSRHHAETMSKKLGELKRGPVLFEKQEDAFLSSSSSSVKDTLEGLDQKRQAFGLSTGRFASDRGSASNTHHRRYEDKEDERELKEERDLEQQRKREAKKAKISFVSSSSTNPSGAL